MKKSSRILHTVRAKKTWPATIGGMFILLVVITFFATKNNTRVGAELAYTDTSALTSVAGSVVPASCDSNDWRGSYCAETYNPSVCHANATLSTCPTTGLSCEYATTSPYDFATTIYPHVGDHFANDCKVACPLGGAYYDPITDPSGSSCPGIKVLWGKNCTLPWGGEIATGESRRAYLASSATSCSYETRTCNDGTLSGSYQYASCTRTSTSGGGFCFVAGTKVAMADGSHKNIEDVAAGEYVLSSSGPVKVKEDLRRDYKGPIYAFNGSGNYFVTPNHPFMTTDGWKSIDPELTHKEIPDLKVSKLEVGDTLILEGGKTTQLTQLDSKYEEVTVYNFRLGGNHEYYADGFLVHNKAAF